MVQGDFSVAAAEAAKLYRAGGRCTGGSVEYPRILARLPDWITGDISS